MCPNNTYSKTVGATSNSSCLACGQNYASDEGSTTCACKPGYVTFGDVCWQCLAGSYKENTGNSTCTPCPSGTYAQIAGATSRSVCIPCEGDLTSPPGSTNCFCKIGYKPLTVGGDCVPCPSGYYQPYGFNETCNVCFRNQYSPEGSSSCFNCTANSSSTAGSAFCSCNPGFELNGTVCVPCAAGTYKDRTDNSTCTPCPEGTSSSAVGATSKTACRVCGPLLASAPGSSSCSCAAGYEVNGFSCVACKAGTFKSSIGNSSCVPCDANRWSNAAASSCAYEKGKLSDENSQESSPQNTIVFAVVGAVSGTVMLVGISATIYRRHRAAKQQTDSGNEKQLMPRQPKLQEGNGVNSSNGIMLSQSGLVMFVPNSGGIMSTNGSSVSPIFGNLNYSLFSGSRLPFGYSDASSSDRDTNSTAPVTMSVTLAVSNSINWSPTTQPSSSGITKTPESFSVSSNATAQQPSSEISKTPDSSQKARAPSTNSLSWKPSNQIPSSQITKVPESSQITRTPDA